ncbi:MAG: phosphatidylglycerophosphatase A [Gammaproteobacteria bacterium]|nr:phosphatidylglycerophosphatase A [Gammaproteobacteria bacterium]MBL6911874.1 phosphatidylglycerophosphatase A [Candidatus Neomarinimicrobiota bacterium]MDC0917841.1 phosphatidylglycerophosphatase A [Candidatus Neomarinimicrobiota bacterium]
MNYQLATLFGLGRLPGGGTWASLFVLIVTILSKDPSNTLLFFISITLLFAPAIYKKSLPLFSSKDPKEFVLDEVIGMALALIVVYTFSSIFGGFIFNLPDYINNQELLFFTTFIVFRIFDISKIGPVGWIDDPNTAPVWWSNIDSSAKDSAYINVIGDDIMAALLAGIIVISILSTSLWVI